MILLASQSAARKSMLEAAGLSFRTSSSPLDEDAAKLRLRAEGLGARDLALRLAEAKALALSGSGLVIGADQTLERDDGTMLDKPASREEARAQLRALSGRTHYLHAAAAAIRNGETLWRGVETVALTMRPLGEAFLESYLDAEYEAIRWCVGGYRIEGPGVQLFSRIEGSHFAILGLPLLPLLAFLRETGALPA